DPTLPMARAQAKSNDSSTSYTFGTVFRANPGGGKPHHVNEVDFDIVHLNSLDLALREAEVIKVIDEVVYTFPSLNLANIHYQIKHYSLFDYLMELYRSDFCQRTTIKRVLSTLLIGTMYFAGVRKVSAEDRISATSINHLARFDWRDDTNRGIAKP